MTRAGVVSVEAAYVYPVKGMTPAPSPALRLAPGQSAEGDRAFVFAFADAKPRGDIGWVSKHESVTLLNTPGLAEIAASWDPRTRTLRLQDPAHGDQAEASVDDEAGREQIAAWLAEATKRRPDNPLTGRPEREPLHLLGDGASAFTDRGPTQISLATLASAQALSEAAQADADVRRFRCNLVLAGGEPWQEFDWAGRRLRVGEALIEVTAPLQRCKAVNANPNGGGRDINLLDVLDARFGHLNFGVEANVIEGGLVRPGDSVELAG